MSWQDFEDRAGEYLKKALNGLLSIVVEPQGGRDSTLPDVKITKNDNVLTNVEIKEQNSQAGQFVIKLVGDKYEFSKACKVDPVPCEPIISHINKNISLYLHVEQNGLPVKLSQTEMAQRIIYHYEITKQSPFIITGEGSNFYVFPTKELEKYFDIQCVIRRKKSGSRNIPLGKLEEIKSLILKMGYNSATFIYKKKKLFIKGDHDLYKEKIDIDDYEDVVYFSKFEKEGNVVKILSKTNNVNVIFTLTLKTQHPGNQINKLIEYIKNRI